MTYLLDTNVLILLLTKEYNRLSKKTTRNSQR